MARFAFKPSQKITLGVLIVFSGICILLSNYYHEKKLQVFDDMNQLYYEQLVELENEVNEIDNEEDIIISEEEEEVVTPPPSGGGTTTPKKTNPPIDYTKYYVGYLQIPKLNLKKGFTDINNKYNTVTRNIQVIKPSDYPDVAKGNFIIAAHSGSTSVSFFKDLYKLKVGDSAVVTYQNKEYTYVIKNIYTVPKTGKVAVRRNKEATTLTLITCTKGDNKSQTVYIAERD